MKSWKLRAGVIATALALAAMMPLASRANTILVERIIAHVNDQIITQRQYDAQAKQIHAQLAEKYSGEELETLYQKGRKNLLRDMIDQDLLVQRAKDDDIDVETDVVKRLDMIRRRYNLNSLEDLQKLVEKEGLIWEDFKDQIRRNLLMQQVIEQDVGGSIIVSQAEARAYFEAHKAEFERPAGVHLAEIVVSTNNRKPEEARKRAEAALAELNNGAKWSDAVAKYSDDPSAQEDGDVGFFKTGTIAPAIAAAIAKLDPPHYSGVIETRYGYMIVRVLDRSTGGVPNFLDVEQQVEGYLYNQKMQDQLRGFLYKLRQESFIRLAPGFVDTGAEPPIERASDRSGK